MINVDHSQCLMFGKSFEPTYILTITTVPSELRAESNKLNALYIQAFMSDLLSVPPERGVLRFEAVPEENLALNGMTVLGSIERIQSMRTVPKRLSASSAVSSPNMNGMSFDPALNKGQPPRRVSKRATERISNPLHLSRTIIPERAPSIRSTVSSVSTIDRPPSPQLQHSRPASSSQQNPLSSSSLADLGFSRNNDSRHSIQTLPGPSYETMSSLSTKPANPMDWTAAASQRRGSRESVQQIGARRYTVNQNHNDTALPPPPIPKNPPPAALDTPAKRKRKSIMSVFRRK